MSSAAASPPTASAVDGNAALCSSTAATASPPPPPPPPPPSVIYWCHECDMSVTLLPSHHAPLICPDCSRPDFLEEMELLHSPSRRLSSPASSSSAPAAEAAALDPPPQSFPIITLSDSDDNDDDNSGGSDPDDGRRPLSSRSARLRRLIDQLVDGGGDDPIPLLSAPVRVGPSPAPAASIDALPTICIPDEVAAALPACAICKDEFPLHAPARRLPCSHLYHSDCIVPWLSLHNSCPICRLPLPFPDETSGGAGGSADGDDDDDDALARALGAADDEALVLTAALWQVRRQHRLSFPVRHPASAALNATLLRMAPVDVVMAGSGETLLSDCPVEGDAAAIGSRANSEDNEMHESRENLF